MLLNRIIISFLVIYGLLIPRTAYAGCDWTQIKKNTDGTYTYTKELHICVGKLVQDNKVLSLQNQDYVKALSLKDLSIQASDSRATLWMNTAASLENRLQSVDKLQKDNEWIFFSLGVVTTFLAGYAAAKLAGK